MFYTILAKRAEVQMHPDGNDIIVELKEINKECVPFLLKDLEIDFGKEYLLGLLNDGQNESSVLV